MLVTLRFNWHDDIDNAFTLLLRYLERYVDAIIYEKPVQPLIRKEDAIVFHDVVLIVQGDQTVTNTSHLLSLNLQTKPTFPYAIRAAFHDSITAEYTRSIMFSRYITLCV
jgi:hypothetical protein